MKLIYPYSKSNPESTDLLLYFWISLILTIPVLLLATGIPSSIPPLISSWLQFILATPVVIGCGWPILKQGWLSIIERHLNMFTLVSIATIVTYVYGMFTLFFSNIFPVILSNINTDFLFEIAATMTSIVLLEQVFEDYVWKKVKGAVPITKQIPTPIEKLTQLLCSYFIFIVLLIAILTFVFASDRDYGLISAISALMIACPAAITLAAPIAILSGAARGEKLGIFINNAACLEQLKNVDVLVIDKDSTTEKSSPLAIKILHKEGIHLVMVTNDDAVTAKNMANRLGIDTIETELSTQQKKDVVQRLRQQGFRVAMTANTSSDAGMTLEMDQDSTIRLMRNDLLDVVRARQLSRKVMSNIQQNLFFAFIYNLVFIPLAAGIFYFWSGSIFNPILAAVLMFSCSAFVMLNALRLQKINFITPQYQ